MASKPNTPAALQAARLPAPALFVGPSSRNASNTSLLLPTGESRGNAHGHQAKPPLIRQRSLLSGEPKRPLPPTANNSQYDGEVLTLMPTNASGAPFQRRQRQQSAAADAEASSRAEAVWAEMQNTLEEVELSAIKGPGVTVFGAEHSRALDELRLAQIELAKAWARSEADENEEAKASTSSIAKVADLEPRTMADSKVTGSGAKGDPLIDKSKLEESTEKDILLSKQRREENDRYFEKVNKGVQEVVVRLEEVAKAMRVVESESKEIWGHGSSSGGDTESLITVASVT